MIGLLWNVFWENEGTWRILQKPYRSDRESLGVLAKILVCLTNLEIRNAPMYSTEKIFNPHPVCIDEEGLDSLGYEGNEDAYNENTEEDNDADHVLYQLVATSSIFIPNVVY